MKTIFVTNWNSCMSKFEHILLKFEIHWISYTVVLEKVQKRSNDTHVFVQNTSFHGNFTCVNKVKWMLLINFLICCESNSHYFLFTWGSVWVHSIDVVTATNHHVLVHVEISPASCHVPWIPCSLCTVFLHTNSLRGKWSECLVTLSNTSDRVEYGPRIVFGLRDSLQSCECVQCKEHACSILGSNIWTLALLLCSRVLNIYISRIDAHILTTNRFYTPYTP